MSCIDELIGGRAVSKYFPNRDDGWSRQRHLCWLDIGDGAAVPASAPSGISVPGDLNGDGIGDLAVGTPLDHPSGKADAGAVQILYGTSQGRVMSPLITEDSTGVADSAEEGDMFGFAVAPAFVDGDQYADIVIGVPNEDLGTAIDAGAIQVLYGSATRIRRRRAAPFAIKVVPATAPQLNALSCRLLTGDRPVGRRGSRMPRSACRTRTLGQTPTPEWCMFCTTTAQDLPRRPWSA